MSGTGAGIGTIAATLLIGVVSDRYSFEPILVGASIVPLMAAALILLLIRNNAGGRVATAPQEETILPDDHVPKSHATQIPFR